MDFSQNFVIKSEQNDVQSEHSIGETLELDYFVKIEEVEAEFIENFYSDEKLTCMRENQWESTENLYCNFLDQDIIEDSSRDGSFRSLQKDCQEECKICHEVFINRYHLIKHNSMHIKILMDFPRMYQCDHCSVFFTEKNKLVDHIYLLHCDNNNLTKPKEMYHCKICQKQYIYKNWHEHMTHVHGKGKFECTICNATFKSLRYLKNHNYNQHGKGNKKGAFKCKICPKTFHYNDCLNKHVQNCHSAPVQCEICDSKLKSAVYLRTHMRRVHYNDGKIHKCHLCSKEFKSPRYVRVHIKNSHSKSATAANPRRKVYMSCECGKRYNRVRELESHLNVCTGCGFETLVEGKLPCL